MALRLAARVPRQRPGRHRRVRARTRPPGREPRPRPPAACPTCPARVLFARRRGALVLGVVKGEEWGWTSPACSALRRSPSRLGRLRVALQPPPLAGGRPRPAADPHLHGRQRDDDRRRRRLLRLHALQRPLPHRGLALLRARGRPRADARPFVAAAVAGPPASWRSASATARCSWSARSSGAPGCSGSSRRSGRRPIRRRVAPRHAHHRHRRRQRRSPTSAARRWPPPPASRFATATGLNSVARQIGAALGVAIVVAIIGQPTTVRGRGRVRRRLDVLGALPLLHRAGCLFLVGRVGAGDDVSRTPSLANAARAVLRLAPAAPVIRPSSPMLKRRGGARPRPRRALTAGVGGRLPRAHPAVRRASPEPLRRRSRRARTSVRLPAGERLFHKDDPGGAMYVVRAGRLEVVRPTAAWSRELGRGAVLGELALLTKSPRSLSVRAARDTDLIAIAAEAFERLLRESPELSLALNRTLAAQLRTSVGTAPETARAATRDRRRAARRSRAGCRDRRPARRRAGPARERGGTRRQRGGATTRRRRPGVLVRPAARPLRGAQRAGGAPHELALRGRPVDRLLPAADGPHPCRSRAARPCRAAPRRAAELRGCDLVAYDVAVGSELLSGWAELLDPVESHAIHTTTLEADIERMGRRLTGRSLGIVLSGGGARGLLAHRRARGADGRGRRDRPRGRREHGRLHRRDVRDGDGDRGDRRPLLRRVDPQPPARRLHAAAALADPRRPRGGDAQAHLRQRARSRSSTAASSAPTPTCAARSWWWTATARSGTAWAAASACRCWRRRACAAAS